MNTKKNIFLTKNIILFLPSFLNVIIIKKVNIFYIKLFFSNYIYIKKFINLKIFLIRNNFFLIILKQNKIILINSLKYFILKITNFFFKKFLLFGLGYKVFMLHKNFKNKILLFKLGFSHNFYLKFYNVKTCVFKNLKIIVFGNFKEIVRYCTVIRLLKIPDVYKGKGVRYYNEKLYLKKIKK